MKRLLTLVTMIALAVGAWGQETWNFKDKDAWPNDKVVTGEEVSYDKDGGTTGTNKVTFKFTAATAEPEATAKGYLANNGFVFWYSDGSATIPSDNYIEVSVPINHKVTFTFSENSTNGRPYYYTTDGANVTTLNATGATKTINYTNSGASAVSMKVWVKNNINGTKPCSYLETIVLEDASSSHHWTVNLLDNAEGHAALKSALTGDAAKDADYTFSLPKVIIKDSKFYVLNESSTQTDFHVTKTMGEADQEWTYYYTEDSDIKYYTELDATTNVNASNGGATYSSNPFTETITETGQYDMSFNVLAQGTGREQWIYVNDQLVKTFTGTSGLQTLTLNIVSASAQVKIKGKENGTATTNFIDYVLIKKTGDAVNTVITTLPTASAITYGDNLSASTLTGGVAKLGAEGEEIEGTFAWTAPETIPNVGSLSYGVTFTPTITSLYTTATCDVAVTVDKATPTITTPPTASAITVGQTLASSTLSGGEASVEGSFAWTNSTIIPAVSDSQTTDYEVTFTPTDNNNYNTVTTNVKLTVNEPTPVNHMLTLQQPATGGSITADNSGELAAETEIKLTATPNAGYQLKSWKSGDETYGSLPKSLIQTISMPNSDLTITAEFEAQPASAPSIFTETTWTFDSFAKGTILSGTKTYVYNGLYINGHNRDDKYQAKVDGSSTEIETGISGNVKNYLEIAGASSATSSTSLTTFEADAVGFYAGVPGTLKVFIKGVASDRGLKFYSSGNETPSTTDNTTNGTNQLFEHEITAAGNVYILSTSGKMDIYAIKFVPATYTFKATSGSNGSITVMKGEDNVTAAVTANEGAIYNYGTSLTLTATPAEGYQFVNWTDDNNSNAVVSTANPYSIASLSANTALTANFSAVSKPMATATTEPAAKESLIFNGVEQDLITDGESSEGTIQYATTEGGEYSTTIPKATNAGSHDVWWKIVADGSHTDKPATKITVTIAKYDISNSATSGTIADQTYTGSALTPDAPSIMMGETVIDAENYNVAYTNNTEVGTATVTYTAKDESTNFSGTKTLNFNIVAAASEEYVSAATTWTFNSQTAGEITSRKVIDKLYARVVSGRSYTFEALATAQTLTFSDGASTQVSVEKVATGTGEIGYNTKIATANDSPSGSSNDMTPSFAFNTTVKGTVYAYLQEIGESHNSNYRQRIYFGNGTSTISSVYSEGGAGALGVEEIKYTSSSAGTFVVGSTKALSKIYAIRFVPIRSITISDAIEHGTVTADKSEGGMGDVVTLTVTPSTGYELGSVSVNGTAIEGTTFAMPDANVTVTATFNAVNYAVTVTQHTGGEVKVSVAGGAPTSSNTTAQYGQIVTLSNTPSGSYTFSSYSVTKTNGGDEVAITNDSFTMPAEAVTVTATFEDSSKTDISGATVTLSESSFICDGSVKAPTVTAVKLGETDLTQGTDYIVNTIESKTNVGTYTVTVTGTGNYTGEATANWKIKRDLGVTLNGTLQWATYFAAENLEVPVGVTVYKVTGVSGTTVSVEAVDYIKANTGVLLYSETAIAPANLIVGAGSGDDYTSELHGSTSAGSMTTGTNYVLYNNQFILAEDAMLPANRCYIHLSSPAASRGLTIVPGNGNTTGIEDIPKDEGEQTKDQYYNMNGQRIDKPTKKGLYIVNGRKVVIK